MRMAIFSDIHGNLEAMEAFVEHVMRKEVDRFVCLGDLVGYGANPSECISLVRSLPNIVVTLGNHDAAVLWDSSPYMMNDPAKEVILWCMENLSEDEKEYLASLPLSHCFNGIKFSHANPYDPKGWHYVNNRKSALRCFRSCKEKLLFVGHTHIPLVTTKKNILQVLFEEPEHEKSIKIDISKRQIFNCGSIGQPRTGTHELNYLIFDSREATITYYAIPYDYEFAGKKIIDAGLPPTLARRLKHGA